jgi:hypothetical protein
MAGELPTLQMTRSRSPTDPVQVFVWVLLVIGLVFFHLFEPFALDAFRSESAARWIHTLFIGVLIAECGILTAGVALCNQPFWLRLCVHWTVALLLSGAWLLGVAIAEDRWSCNDLVREIGSKAMLLCLPLICLAAQAPLWLARLLFQWRIEHINLATSRESPHLPAIPDMMIAAVVAAISIATAGAGFMLVEGWGALALFVILLIVSAVNMIAIGPLLASILGPQHFRSEVLACGLSAAVVAVPLLLAKCLLSADWALLVIPLVLGYFAALVSVSWIARLIGFRLKIRPAAPLRAPNA